MYQDKDYLLEGRKKTNPLLVRSVVGKVRTTTYDVPPADFSYGQSDIYLEDGAKEAISSWNSHQPTPAVQRGRDFVKSNKMAAMDGCVTSTQIKQFRKTHDIRKGPDKRFTKTGVKAQAPPVRPDRHVFGSSGRQLVVNGKNMENTVFGRPSKPSTPIHSVVRHKFLRSAVEERKEAAEQAKVVARKARQARAQQNSGTFRASKHTRASLGHQKVKLPPPGPLYKLPQFRDVPARVIHRVGKYKPFEDAKVEAAPTTTTATTATAVAENNADTGATTTVENAQNSTGGPTGPSSAQSGPSVQAVCGQGQCSGSGQGSMVQPALGINSLREVRAMMNANTRQCPCMAKHGCRCEEKRQMAAEYQKARVQQQQQQLQQKPAHTQQQRQSQGRSLRTGIAVPGAQVRGMVTRNATTFGKLTGHL